MKYLLRLLLPLIILGCSKQDYVGKSEFEINEWKLVSLKSEIALSGIKKTDSSYLSSTTGYLRFVNDSIVETNIVMDAELSSFLSINNTYNSSYISDGETLLIKINDEDYQQKIPVKFIVSHSSPDKMVLRVDSNAFEKVISYYNELEGEKFNDMIINWLYSSYAELIFRK